jgi:hypothetical protein
MHALSLAGCGAVLSNPYEEGVLDSIGAHFGDRVVPVAARVSAPRGMAGLMDQKLQIGGNRGLGLQVQAR